ncbi:class I SAM-dependent methyltransferase [Streptomyces cinereoruber]|uniref:Class I SAM-dependent methyltransferase n=2 Tax=Streptomyces cinereoruber TaxID=67260 RepID=A0ABX6BAT3_9ACTN|nr:class I SAM-dependent methyltransferase [Streptomyces cinereoruber]MBB4158784.1 SAM-dependent methyltransferase [Streptomyces cinereoruber]MBY8816520.1 class I SAM-dependent methyltransferase [Streptomyces cinereoruber]NIH65284.1 SAM-dependent methyltransferase [Streptomyces cinereoruber]QEV31008.1 class I SAM-dependent methyltransferase [Streptomyces cinereoruber]
MPMTTRRTRWQEAGSSKNYGKRFAELVSAGEDIDGEARLADTLLPRGARVLDAGAGMGRVTAALLRRGHDVVAIEPDETLVRQARETYPGLPIQERDILDLDPDDGPFDLVVCVGNVMVYLAEGTERAALHAMRAVLGENGRILIGFHLQDRPPHAHAYTAAEFEADLAAAGLRVDLRAGTYQLHPANEAYGVWVLSRARNEAGS